MKIDKTKQKKKIHKGQFPFHLRKLHTLSMHDMTFDKYFFGIISIKKMRGVKLVNVSNGNKVQTRIEMS